MKEPKPEPQHSALALAALAEDGNFQTPGSKPQNRPEVAAPDFVIKHGNGRREEVRPRIGLRMER